MIRQGDLRAPNIFWTSRVSGTVMFCGNGFVVSSMMDIIIPWGFYSTDLDQSGMSAPNM
jgi:hypothetical protein